MESAVRQVSDAAPDSDAKAPQRLGRRLLWALYAILLPLSLYLSFKVTTFLVGIEPDQLHTYLLWSGAKTHGIGWIKDWIFTQDNWLLSLFPLHVLLFETLGPDLRIAIYFGWFTFAASAAVAGLIAWRLGAGKVAVPLALCLLTVGLYAHDFGFASYATSHNITNLFGLVSLFLLIVWMERPRPWLLAPLSLLLICGGVSDPWMTATYQLPLALVALLFLARPPAGVRRLDAAQLLLTAVVSILAVKTRLFGVLWFLPQLHYQFGGAETAWTNGLFVIRDVGGLLNLVPFATGADLAAGLASCLVVFGLLGFFLLRPFPAAATLTGPQLAVLLVALLSMGGAAAAMTLSDVRANPSSARFVVNCLYLVAILLFWLGAAKWRVLPRWSRGLAVLALVLFLTASGVSNAPAWTRPGFALKDRGSERIAAFLAANGLTYGYGPYLGSVSNAVSAVSGYKTLIRPVSFTKDYGMLIPGIRSQSSRRWFRADDPPAGTSQYFVFVRRDEEECLDLDLCLRGLQRQFGPAAKSLAFEGATILVWDHPLLNVATAPLDIALDKTLETGATGVPLRGVGWSAPEKGGTWMDGGLARFSLKLPAELPEGADLSFLGIAVLDQKRPAFSIAVTANGTQVGALDYELGEAVDRRTVHIPAAALHARGGRLDIELRLDRPVSPLELGLSNDPRRISLGLKGLVLSRPAPDLRIPMVLNQPILTRAGGAPLTDDGWAAAESWGAWTTSSTARIRLRAPTDAQGDLDLVFDGHAFLSRGHSRQSVAVVVNGQPVGSLDYSLKQNSGERAVRVPAALLRARGGDLDIELRIEKPMSPSQLKVSADPRRLGLGLVALSLRPHKAS